MIEKNKLSIYLIKAYLKDVEEILDMFNKNIKPLLNSKENLSIFYLSSRVIEPG